MAACAFACLLAGCSTSAPDNITLDGGAPAVENAKARDVDTQSIKWTRTKPGCKGTCPTVELDSIRIVNEPKLTALIDHVLAFMTGVDTGAPRAYQTVDEYVQYFWSAAQSKDVTRLQARVKHITPAAIVIELDTTQAVTGAAHVIPATQYLNWERQRGRVLALDEALVPGKKGEFFAALKQAHDGWAQKFPDARRDRASFDRMWPFQESENFALGEDGITVKYDAYSIAPYSAGQPELTVPYASLRGILLPEWFPKD